MRFSLQVKDSGPYVERRFAGPRSVTILGLNTGTLDLTVNGWGHLVGMEGERKKLYTKEGKSKVEKGCSYSGRCSNMVQGNPSKYFENA